MKRVTVTVCKGVLAVVSTIAVATLSSSVRADDADWGHAITKCFHPTGSYLRAQFGPLYQDGPERTAQTGRVDFTGLLGAEHSLNFVRQFTTIGGDRKWRIVPGTDTAPMPPSPVCYMRDWQNY